ncbi:uncharacterized protein LY89DRAFT_727968 [Mollisia scopiformis]|uniref:Uncharacterized protein n=1 Tax=Mollisia scopiformis TaxID=149040 RepID=A0A194XSM4_MOLSC|nr:uncharacterized protein LY89DRAFT_727968 [Mollisia scopiformis]KUJ23198.1 hypothetical protein LY89DRAFT_727968 [Mollisia scopiformis]
MADPKIDHCYEKLRLAFSQITADNIRSRWGDYIPWNLKPIIDAAAKHETSKKVIKNLTWQEVWEKLQEEDPAIKLWETEKKSVTGTPPEERCNVAYVSNIDIALAQFHNVVVAQYLVRDKNAITNGAIQFESETDKELMLRAFNMFEKRFFTDLSALVIGGQTRILRCVASEDEWKKAKFVYEKRLRGEEKDEGKIVKSCRVVCHRVKGITRNDPQEEALRLELISAATAFEEAELTKKEAKDRHEKARIRFQDATLAYEKMEADKALADAIADQMDVS